MVAYGEVLHFQSPNRRRYASELEDLTVSLSPFIDGLPKKHDGRQNLTTNLGFNLSRSPMVFPLHRNQLGILKRREELLDSYHESRKRSRIRSDIVFEQLD